MKKKSIWIAGAAGRIGKRLVKELKKDLEARVIATDTDVDVTDLEAVNRAFDLYKPNVVINCASISDAEYCEKNRVEAFKVNTLGARNLAAASASHNAKIIHLSTDDVFSGISNRSKSEFDLPTPVSVYGQSKYAGEQQVRELNPKHLIIRSSWIYGVEGDYLSFVLNQAKKGEQFEASLDRISTPTSADEIVKFILVMLDHREYGVFHASDEGLCSRHQYATKVLTEFGYDPALAIGTFANTEGAIVSTVLENLMMKMTGIYEMPDWEKDLEQYIAGMKGE